MLEAFLPPRPASTRPFSCTTSSSTTLSLSPSSRLPQLKNIKGYNTWLTPTSEQKERGEEVKDSEAKDFEETLRRRTVWTRALVSRWV